MKLKVTSFLGLFLFISSLMSAQENINLTTNFDKIIVSPHIEVVFKKGNNSSIVIDDINVSREKFKYEIKNGTLQVYLEGAKTYTKSKKTQHEGYSRKTPLYKNRVVVLTITYTDVEVFSVRGEEKITFETPLKQQNCKLRIYGDSEVTINEVDLDKLGVTIYGESYLKLMKGSINRQKITAYGASKVMAYDVVSKETKVTAYGDGTYQVNASEKVKVTSYGEAKILYKGEASLKKGIVIGESTISKVM
ncbi:Putative auto-transporter adhesin, head GIN domain [Tenacibaculum sp. MAR_2009_124]|uniref:head GIN domain-containing protein n=1 Tax=Tenacibaculum sp. MAR_2009_124 TaxID=1250059 RepID=UPI00089A8849|nr:head GIN domain-containing protein [Tenacibaculum sp. MAR_2009_124]SEB47804.1 Putative auto-transporter adhesin, head GIN domain [Tenacibaculum sp. MAR_2009_124]